MLVGPLRVYLSIWLKWESWVTCYGGELADTMQIHHSVQIYSHTDVGSLTCIYMVCDHKRLISLKKKGYSNFCPFGIGKPIFISETPTRV